MDWQKRQTFKLALVVDDSISQCKVLSGLLKKKGYKVFLAHDGLRAVSLFDKYQPDLVLMDINMPVMNGYEATRRIKKLSKGNLAPLIFITSLDSEKAYIDSIEAGGDGVLCWPFSPEVFYAKIKSMERINELYQQIKALQEEQHQDAEFAEQLLTEVIESRNYGQDKIGFYKQATALFSGDILLSALSPNGDVYVMLGDFTGHGLRSSIGAVPLSETFRAMTKKGFALVEIIHQINDLLYKLLPSDLFLAGAFVSVSALDKSVSIFNAGLPEVYLVDSDGIINQKVESFHPPIGILPKLLAETKAEVFENKANQYVVLLSDGIVEARNPQDEMYDFERFEQALSDGAKQNKIVEVITASLNDFCQDVPKDDDVSLISIPCSEWQSYSKEHNLIQSIGDETISLPAWQWDISLSGERLSNVNPVPILMSHVQEIEGTDGHWQSVYTILTELFINALDHGVLQLDSAIKESPEGFADYYSQRDKLLSELKTGFITLSFAYHLIDERRKIVIKVKDSGAGFNFHKYVEENNNTDLDHQGLSGRGILLVKQLCDALEYHENGTLVEASYVWHQK